MRRQAFAATLLVVLTIAGCPEPPAAPSLVGTIETGLPCAVDAECITGLCVDSLCRDNALPEVALTHDVRVTLVGTEVTLEVANLSDPDGDAITTNWTLDIG